MDLALDALRRGLVDGFKPDPHLLMSEWADQYRQLVAESGTKEHGRMQVDRTPYMREIMDCLSPQSPVRHVVVQKGGQVGATEALVVTPLGYVIHISPGSVMCLNPTVELSEDFSKDRFTPTVEAMPILRSRMKEKSSRTTGNTEGPWAARPAPTTPRN